MLNWKASIFSSRALNKPNFGLTRLRQTWHGVYATNCKCKGVLTTKQNRSPLQPALWALRGRSARPSTHLITLYQYTGVSSLQVRGGQDSEETGSVHFATFKALGLPAQNFYSPRCIDVSVQAGVWLLYTVKSWTSRVIKIKGSGLAISSDFVVLSQWRLTGQRDGHCHWAGTALASDPGGHHHTQPPTSSWREPAQFQGPVHK